MMNKNKLRSLIRDEIMNEIGFKPDDTSKVHTKVEQLLDMTGWIGDNYFIKTFSDKKVSKKTLKQLDVALKIIEKVAIEIDKAPSKGQPRTIGFKR